MKPTTVFTLNLQEDFPHLSHPPIVEAVIQWQARAQNALESEEIRAALIQSLPDYPSCEPVQNFELSAIITGQGDAEPRPAPSLQKGWHGYRLTSADQRQVIQFNRDGVAFSRVRDYQDWQQFLATAMPAWEVFRKLGAPLEIQRLGVRFINHIPAATPERLKTFLREPPTCPSDLPLKEFVYQSTFSVPEHPYEIRVTKVMQQSMPGLPDGSGFFIDCDVFTTRPIAIDDSELNNQLVRMRWLKNKIFFSLLTDQAIRSFQ